MMFNGNMVGMEAPLRSTSNLGQEWVEVPDINQWVRSTRIPDSLYNSIKKAIDDANDIMGDMAPEPSAGPATIDAVIAYLNDLRAVMNIFQMRAAPDFVQNYISTLHANFANWPDMIAQHGNLKRAYTFLGFKNIHDAIKMPYSYFTALITAKLSSGALSEDDQFFLRQCAYIFRYAMSKHLFDAYLQHGEKGLKKFKLNNDLADRYLEVYDALSMAKAELENYQRKLKIREEAALAVLNAQKTEKKVTFNPKVMSQVYERDLTPANFQTKAEHNLAKKEALPERIEHIKRHGLIKVKDYTQEKARQDAEYLAQELQEDDEN